MASNASSRSSTRSPTRSMGSGSVRDIAAAGADFFLGVDMVGPPFFTMVKRAIIPDRDALAVASLTVTDGFRPISVRRASGFVQTPFSESMRQACGKQASRKHIVWARSGQSLTGLGLYGQQNGAIRPEHRTSLYLG